VIHYYLDKRKTQEPCEALRGDKDSKYFKFYNLSTLLHPFKFIYDILLEEFAKDLPMLHILMFHYVRNNEDYSYDCYARRFSEFESQINFLSKNLDVASPGDTEKIEYYLLRDDKSACLLTFDDGYKDHALCSKFLQSKSISAIFFPPINAVKGELLDVNAIHYLIGERSISKDELLKYIVLQVKEKNLRIRSFIGLPVTIEEYLRQGAVSRYDDASTTFIKRLLQRDIVDDSIRRDVIHKCLSFFSNLNISEHAKDLYLSAQEMQQMRLEGMYFGSHGLTHRWLSRLDAKEQEAEILKSFEELEKLSLFDKIQDPKVLCYPYGSYNSETITIQENQAVTYSLTTHVGAATGNLSSSSRLELNRWDTNDFWCDQWRRPTMPS